MADQDRGAPSPPLIVILGGTGTGKTKVAIAMSRALEASPGNRRCEVINADVLQCYAGSPIVTNKATAEEQAGVAHHLLDWADPLADMKMEDFRSRARRVIAGLQLRGVVPIVVGGSDYYVKSLVSRHFDLSSVSSAEAAAAGDDEEEGKEEEEEKEAPRGNELSDTAAYEALRRLDPVSAARLHPNNTRRVRRYLEICLSSGKPASALFLEQRQPRASGTGDNGATSLLYPCCIFLLDADDAALEPRLRQRVVEMLERGMMRELEELYGGSEASRLAGAAGRGIFQAIGVKEFRGIFGQGTRDLLSSNEAEISRPRCEINVGNVDQGEEEEGLERALEEMKRNTMKLARKQRRRMVRWLEGEGIPFHPVDMTECLRSGGQAPFDKVMQHVLLCVENFFTDGAEPMVGREGAKEKEEEEKEEEALLAKWRAYECEPCGRTLRGWNEWAAHQKASGHKKRCAKVRKLFAEQPCEFKQHYSRETNTVTFKCTPRVEAPGSSL